MDPKLVTKFRKEAGDIKIRGKCILNPVFNWYHCGFSDSILTVIEKNGYEKPFPIQSQSIPMISSGRDVIGIAETGSGKTFAYLLPMLKHVAAQRPCE
jgi:ATP-dependent RNA helicase DDX46/PRP5